MTVNFYGLGELPGASIIAAADIVAGETGDLRQLPILPDRGVDVVGLTTGILPGINVGAQYSPAIAHSPHVGSGRGRPRPV